MADYQDIFVNIEAGHEALETFERTAGSEFFTQLDGGFIAQLGADKRGRLERSFEWAGDDQIHVDAQGIEVAADEQTLLLAFFVQRPFSIEDGVGAFFASTGVPEQVQVHKFTYSSNINRTRPATRLGYPISDIG